MKLLKRYSSFPIVGQWIHLSKEESAIVMMTLNSSQIGNLENGGWAKTEYQIGTTRWPSAIIRMIEISK